MEQTRLLYCRYWVRANQLYHKHNFPHVLIGLEIITSPPDKTIGKRAAYTQPHQEKVVCQLSLSVLDKAVLVLTLVHTFGEK